jgi:hypothetical protein
LSDKVTYFWIYKSDFIRHIQVGVNFGRLQLETKSIDMNRKEFLKNSLLATGALLLPNAVWAFDKSSNVEQKNLNKFLSKPNLERFKISEIGIKFFETELSIQKNKTNLKLHKKYFISENINGISTPTLLETNNNESLVFIPELYKDNKHNGFIVKVCKNGLCEETKIFTHENQGNYAFWGKEYLGHPTLYHYNIETFHLMRIHKKNNNWINHRVMPIYPNEMIVLYKQQLQQVEQGQLTQQFGYDFEIHKDGFYQFLSLKNDWEQSIVNKHKEVFEKENPAQIYTDTTIVKPAKIKFDGYTNPFVPIYCKGDDLSYATIKPTIIYEEVAGTKIEIENMPAYKTQDDLGDCKAFSLAAILQQYVNTKWKSEIPDPKNPPVDSAISYFGLMAYTNQVPNQTNTFQPNQNQGVSMDIVINEISNNGNRLILEDCKPYENLTKEFSLNGKKGLIKRDEFFNYTKSIYDELKNKNDTNIKDYLLEVDKLNKFVNLKFNQKTLKNALKKNNYNEFLYELFFSECRKEDFPTGFSDVSFPLDSMNVTTDEIRYQIIKGLKKGQPVLLPSICTSQDKSYECSETHSLVISGFKKVANSNNMKFVFKIHNSWGEEWQKKNNDGWCDADLICQNTAKIKSTNGSYRISSGSVTWLEE